MKVVQDERKLAELIVYISLKCEADESFGATKLNKLLFFAELAAFRVRGRAITGVEYQKLDYGPAPRRLVPVREELEKLGRLKVRRSNITASLEQQKPIALDDPALDLFTPDEIAIVDDVLRMFWGKTAKEVSDASHRLVSWQIAEPGETIAFEAELVADEPGDLDDHQRAGLHALRDELLREDRSPSHRS